MRGRSDMSAGPPTNVKVEIEFVSGTWVDVTADVDPLNGVTIQQGGTQVDALQPATVGFTLRNSPNPATGISPYTPDNPLGPYYPNVVERKRVRVTVYRGATPYTRGMFWVDSVTPEFPGGELSAATTTVTGSDVLGQLGRRTLLSDYGEQAIYQATATGTTLDYWPFDDDDKATTLRNVGGGAAARVVPAASAVGSYSLAEPGGWTTFDGAITVEPGSTVGGSDGRVGPIILCPLVDANVSTLGFWVRIPAGSVPSSTPPIPELVCGYDKAGSKLWALNLLNNGQVTFEFSWNNGANLLDYQYPVNDDLWRYVYVTTDGTNFTLAIDSFTWNPVAFDILRPTRYVTVGGSCPPKAPGKQKNGWPCSVGGLAAWHGTTVVGAVDGYARLYDTDLTTRIGDLQHYTGVTITSVGANNRQVARAPVKDRNALDVLGELALTVGGTVYVDSTGALTLTRSDAARPLSPQLTVKLESDDDAGQPFTLERAALTKPTRVTASCPDGTVTLVDTATETALGVRNDLTVATTAASVDGARDVAGFVLNQAVVLRISQLSVDLVTAEDDLYAAALACYPGQRIRVTNTPTAYLGVTQVDVHVRQITETVGVDWYRVTFDTVPADAPPEARFDNTTTGRFAAGGTMTLADAETASDTTIRVTTASGPLLTTAAGAYPLDLDVNGERVTVASAPGGTSPQTLTVTRGVAPTVARAHTAGEPVEVWQAARFAF